MTERAEPRIPPLTDAELGESARELLDIALQPDTPPAENLMRTLARYPGLLRRWLPYGGKLLAGGKLPARLREICILRVAVLTRADYEWSQHVPIGLDAGLTRDEIDGLLPTGSHPWSEQDAALVAAVDEMHHDGRISQPTWDVLAGFLTEQQLVELPLLVGAYTGLAYFLNSFQVAVEPGLEGLPDRA